MYKGKAIYNPSGKAGEYSEWACNFYVGCSNGCTYCYCKKGILAGAMGQDKPQLKKCFKNEQHALELFEKEMLQNRVELKEHGLFFSFTTDPMLPETIELTRSAAELCLTADIPVIILTKRTDWIDEFSHSLIEYDECFSLDWTKKYLLAIGFTLTGHDELEPGASTNASRIREMEWLNSEGIKTFASIEPVIDFESSLEMIKQSLPYCDHFKIGLESGKKYNHYELVKFVHQVNNLIDKSDFDTKIYWKESVMKKLKLKNGFLWDFCVERDYNIFGNT